MAESQSPPERSLGGLRPDKAFSLLGNKTRLDILSALWDAGAHHLYGDVDDSAPSVTFTELQRATGIRDKGHFNYHLSKLVPDLVVQTEDGYRLSGAALAIVRSVMTVASDGLADGGAELATPCPTCDGSLTSSYEDQWFLVQCSDCRGIFGEMTPDGTVYHAPFPAASLEHRSSDEAFSAGSYRCILEMTYLMRRLCPECSGVMSGSVTICDSYDTSVDQLCPTCETDYEVWGDMRCGTCRFAKRLPIEVFAMGLTPVIAFCHERGVDILSATSEDLERIDELFTVEVADDRRNIFVTIDDGHDRLRVVLDQELHPTEIDQ